MNLKSILIKFIWKSCGSTDLVIIIIIIIIIIITNMTKTIEKF